MGKMFITTKIQENLIYNHGVIEREGNDIMTLGIVAIVSNVLANKPIACTLRTKTIFSHQAHSNGLEVVE